MMRLFSLLLLLLFFSVAAMAQSYSSHDLMEVKEESEAMRLSWNKAFDEAVQTKNFAGLAAARKANEDFLDRHISGTRRLFAQGDGRALLTSVSNYLQIGKQFVKDVMEPAESLTAADQAAIDNLYQKITDFSQKEQIFLVDIENALATEPPSAGASLQMVSEIEEEAEEEYEEPQGSVVEGRRGRSKGRLPHEQYDEKKGRKNKRSR